MIFLSTINWSMWLGYEWGIAGILSFTAYLYELIGSWMLLLYVLCTFTRSSTSADSGRGEELSSSCESSVEPQVS